MKIQYDYIRCYLSMLTGETKLAKEIALEYVVYTVFSWRDLFHEVLSQIYELESKSLP